MDALQLLNEMAMLAFRLLAAAATAAPLCVIWLPLLVWLVMFGVRHCRLFTYVNACLHPELLPLTRLQLQSNGR